MTKLNTMLIEKRFLDLIKSGEKRVEIRRWYKELQGQWIPLEEVESGKKNTIILIGDVFHLDSFDDEEKQLILDEALVPEDFRETYDCKYAYTIEDVRTIH